MLWSTFLSTLKHQMLQNTGREFFNDSLYYVIMTEGLQDIYMWLNSKDLWSYAFMEETVAQSATEKEFETTYPIMGIVDEKYGEEYNTGVKAGEYFLDKKTFATNESFVMRNNSTQPVRQYTFLIDKTDWFWYVKWIKTSEAYDSIQIRYLREPTKVTSDNLDEHLDIPEMLSRTLRLYCMMELMPSPYLDTGANMSEFYFKRYQDALKSYASSIGSAIDFRLVSR